MIKRPITEKQVNLLNFIKNYQWENNEIPTFQRMADYQGVTIPAIQTRLQALERRGLIKRENKYIITEPMK